MRNEPLRICLYRGKDHQRHPNLRAFDTLVCGHTCNAKTEKINKKVGHCFFTKKKMKKKTVLIGSWSGNINIGQYLI